MSPTAAAAAESYSFDVPASAAGTEAWIDPLAARLRGAGDKQEDGQAAEQQQPQQGIEEELVVLLEQHQEKADKLLFMDDELDAHPSMLPLVQLMEKAASLKSDTQVRT